jgi:hypothetical protein
VCPVGGGAPQYDAGSCDTCFSFWGVSVYVCVWRSRKYLCVVVCNRMSSSVSLRSLNTSLCAYAHVSWEGDGECVFRVYITGVHASAFVSRRHL